MTPRVLRSIADSNRFFPVTEKVRQVDYFGGFTAAAGHALYTARTYPKVYWNSTAFVSEPTGHLTATFALERRGSDFASHNEWNLLASDDEWTSPIQAEVGPDGNVWVIDWYNYIVQHNPTPRGFKTGKGAAYETPLRDKTHGRIYRVVYTAGTPTAPVKLNPGDPKTLLMGLKSDNMLWRMHAQRLLVERGGKDVIPALIALVNDPSSDGIGLNPAAIHALWTLHGLGAIAGANGDPKAAEAAGVALKHPSAGVRRNALQVLPRTERAAGQILAAGSLRDSDAQVKLAAFLALSEMPRNATAGKALAEALDAGAIEGDAWLPDSAVIAGAAHDLPFLQAVAARARETKQAPRDTTLKVVRQVAEHYARGGPADSAASLLAALVGTDRTVSGAVVAGLAAGWPRDKHVALNADNEKALATLLTELPTEARAPFISLASRWGSDALDRHSAEIAKSLLTTVQDAAKPDEARTDAARQLVEFRPRDADVVKQLLQQITPRTSPALASALVTAVGRSESPEAGKALVEFMPSLSPSARDDATRALLTRADRIEAFLGGVEKGTIPLAGLTLDQKQALASHPNATIAAKAKALLAQGGGLPDPDRQKVIDAIAPLALRGGDPTKGKEVFKQQCAKCHTHNGEGAKVGPDLTGMSVHPREELLVHILDPSRSVEGNFLLYSVATTDGRVINGLLASESKNAVELVDTEGKTQTILRGDIEEMVASKKSLMPEGFEKQVPPEAVADLLAFLTQRGKYVPLDFRKAATVVSTQGMFYSKESPMERLVFSDWSPKTFDGIPFHLVDPQGNRVPNMIMLFSPNGEQPPRMPRSVTLPCHTGAKAIHFLSGISGWGAADDGTPPTVSMIVRLHYVDGKTEDHPLKNGVHFADYIRRIDVPGSKLAFMVRGRQVRYLSVRPERAAPIDRIELIKGPDDTAPVIVAATVEVAE
jgi:putative heme-binding domain-containing protein